MCEYAIKMILHFTLTVNKLHKSTTFYVALPSDVVYNEEKDK